MKQLSVKELMDKLVEMPQDMPVSVEGCDCYQAAAGCKVQDGYVLVFNTDGTETAPTN